MTVPPRFPQHPSNFFLTLYFGFKIAPVVGAVLALYLGYRLFILGVTGQASLTINSNSIGGQLLNAAPGLFFAVGGIVIMVVVVWKGIDLEINNIDPKGRSVEDDRIKKRVSNTYSGGGGGGGPDMRAGCG